MATRKPPYAASGIGFLLMLVLCLSGRAQSTSGFKYNNLTVSPFVNLEYSYDSNVDYDGQENDDSILTINPGVDLTYRGNDWGLDGKAWYGYDKYKEYDDLDQDRYGESLRFYAESPRGLRFILGQNYIKTHQDDSILDGGRGIWRERDLHEIMSALSYQISERSSVTLNGMYSDLSYQNDSNQFGNLYGWREWSVGMEVARKLTAKSNLLLSGSYQEYDSDGAQGIDSNSSGYTLMAGFGSRATERISYRALTGASWFDYANGDQLTGWVYSLDANWIINRKLVWSVAGSSYFQPSEREANQAMQVYVLSTGLSYRPAKRVTTRFDIGMRREENEYSRNNQGAVTSDKFSARVRADYRLQKYVSLYGSLTYEEQISDDNADEFDRLRGTVGLNFRY
ncbi:MAG: outer membrane beta-barrel protein [Kiritimatiellae bacterium]|nr:outer membrane beta-barrel protein [Kiritimatiellia bacterium]